MSLLPLPVGKNEFYDGTSWFSLASENWVLNTIAVIAPCLVATTTNLNATYTAGSSTANPGIGATLTNAGEQSALDVDGVATNVGDRILVANQASVAQNGIYIVTNNGTSGGTWILTRTTDFDSSGQMNEGLDVKVIAGIVNSLSDWMLTGNVKNVGTDPVLFYKMGSTMSNISNISGTANEIDVAIADEVATISLSNNTIIPGTGSLTLPVGTTDQRPAAPAAGMIRWNTSLT